MSKYIKEKDQELVNSLLLQHTEVYVNEDGDLFTNESYAKLSGKDYEAVQIENKSEQIEVDTPKVNNTETQNDSINSKRKK